MPGSILHPLICQGRANPEWSGELLETTPANGSEVGEGIRLTECWHKIQLCWRFYDLYINMLESMPTGSNEIEAGICSGVLWKCSSRKAAIGWQHCLLFSWSLNPGVLNTARCNFTPCFPGWLCDSQGWLFFRGTPEILSLLYLSDLNLELIKVDFPRADCETIISFHSTVYLCGALASGGQ